MTMLRQARATVGKALFGPSGYHHQCLVGLPDPQQEVAVWLQGLDSPIDVTERNTIASPAPLTIGIGLDGNSAKLPARSRVSLELRERAGAQRLLAEVKLQFLEKIEGPDGPLHLFELVKSTNHCATPAQLLRHYMERRYEQMFKNGKALSYRSVLRESFGTLGLYICPRPLVLVSAMNGSCGNICPMDLGPISGPPFSLALQRDSTLAGLVEQCGRIAVSSVPVAQAAAALALGRNYRRKSVDWNDLPFVTTLSAAWQVPVPAFALRVREMEITEVRAIGSHKLFLAHVVKDQRWQEGPHLHIAHGFYEAWRRRDGHPLPPIW